MATIQGIYIALFGRPADPAGLAFFNEQTSNGADLTAIGDLAATAEYQDRFDGLSNVQIVTKIYQDLFGRDPDAAGLAFFVAALNAGTLDINSVAINILDGAQGDDLAIVNNKIAAANLFTAEIDTAVEVGSYVGDDAADLGRAFLSGITADEATVPSQADAAAAVQGVVDFGLAGNTFSVAFGTDVVVGDDATTDSSNNNDTITVTGDYDPLADVNAGLGNDRVNIELAGGVYVTDDDSLVGVERLYITAAVASSIDLDVTSGLQQVWSSDSADSLSVSNIDLGTVVGIDGTNASVYFGFDADGTSDAATVVVDGSVTSLQVDEIEELTVNVADDSSIGNSYINEADALTITGSGDLELVYGGNDSGEATIDASDLDGKFSFNNDGYNDLDVVGGASNDTFTISAGAEGIVLTGNGGSDLFDIGSISNFNNANDLADDLISITDFNGSADTLRLNVTGAEDALNNVEVANITGAADLAEALDFAANATTASNYSIFQYDGNTYIFQNDAVAGLSNGDGVVELVGFTGDLTGANFVAY